MLQVEFGMDNHGRLRVMVLDGDARQALPFLRSMKRAGHHVTVFCYTRFSPGYLSRYPDRRVLVPVKCEDDPERFGQIVLAHLRTGRYDVILPFGHYTMLLCVRRKGELTRHALLPVPDEPVFMRAQDKAQTMSFCADSGIPCPLTYFPDREGLESIFRRAEFPLWLKPTISVGAIGGRRVDTPDQARRVYPVYRQKYGPMIFQEYIPHAESVQLVYHTFLDAQVRTCAAMVSLKPRYFPPRGGTSTCLVSVDRPDVLEYGKRLFEGIGLTGIADADIIVDPRDGRAKVMEINPRVSCSIKIGFAAGIDYADMWLRLATGRPIAPKLPYRKGLVLRNLCQDLLWHLFADRKARKQAQPPFFRFFGPDVMYQTLSLDDPLAFPGFVLNMLCKYASREARASKMGTEV